MGELHTYCLLPIMKRPLYVFLSGSPDTAEKILFLFASLVYLCPSLATPLNYCMCERGNWLINRLKKLKIFQNLFNNVFFFLNALIWCCSGFPGELRVCGAIAHSIYTPVDPAAWFPSFRLEIYSVLSIDSSRSFLASLVTTPWIRWSRKANTTTYFDNFGPVSENKDHRKGQFPRIYNFLRILAASRLLSRLGRIERIDPFEHGQGSRGRGRRSRHDDDQTPNLLARLAQSLVRPSRSEFPGKENHQ